MYTSLLTPSNSRKDNRNVLYSMVRQVTGTNISSWYLHFVVFEVTIRNRASCRFLCLLGHVAVFRWLCANFSQSWILFFIQVCFRVWKLPVARLAIVRALRAGVVRPNSSYLYAALLNRSIIFFNHRHFLKITHTHTLLIR